MEDNIKQRLIDQKYDAYVEKLANEAEVKINQRVYDRIRTDR